MRIEFAHLLFKLMLLGIPTRVEVHAMPWSPTVASRGLLRKL